jgi:putative inorganic carbon (HCO3(-)) transporter
MRDLLIVTIVALGCLYGLKRPWIGLAVWIWLSIMNPHKYAFGFSYSAPLAQVAVLSVGLGMLLTKDKLASPFQGGPNAWFMLLTVWITFTWALGWDPMGDWNQWTKIMKINIMVMVTLVVAQTKQQIFGIASALIGSMALLGIKGGLHTLATGGGGRVWGPPGSFIADNNEFACAVLMTIPMLRFLQLQVTSPRIKHAFTATIVLCLASALGSQSRGALVALLAVALFLWWKGKAKFQVGVLMLLVGFLVLVFMPESWTDRMETIDDYKTDASALGRLSAWWMAWNMVQDYPLGIGLNAVRPELFAMYSPYPTFVYAAHSIYFQMLGHHGYLGVLIFLGLWWATWRSCSDLIKIGRNDESAKWVADLGAMTQLSLVAYLAGGAFLSLAYFDLPYYLMILVVAARLWVGRRAKLNEGPVPTWQARLGWGEAIHAQKAAK